MPDVTRRTSSAQINNLYRRQIPDQDSTSPNNTHQPFRKPLAISAGMPLYSTNDGAWLSHNVLEDQTL